MKQILLITCFLLTSFSSFSQYIEGKVLDAETNKPIEGVHVIVKGINRGALTNAKGNFYIKFPYKVIESDVIKFSHLTYGTVEVPYIQKKKNYMVYLQLDITKLKEVEIRNKRNLRPTLKYETLSKMNNAVSSFGSTLNDGKIYVLGGDVSYHYNSFKRVMEYDPESLFAKMMSGTLRNYSKDSYKGNLQIFDIESNSWKDSDIEFRKRAYHNIQHINNKLYVFGGKRLSKSRKKEYLDDKIEIFDLEKNSIQIDDTNPHQAADFTSFVYNNNLVVMGGSIKQNSIGVRQYTNKVHSFNPETGHWHQIGSIPVAKETNGVLVNDKFYLIGGYNAKALFSIESFSLKTGKWKREGELFSGMIKPALATNNGVIYIFNNGKLVTFNTLTAELNEYLIELYLKNSKMFFYNNKLYILGGFNENNYSVYPTKGVYSIDIEELPKTKIHKSESF
jgi:N-acetylneuraminic acid mutarotase